MRLQSKFIPVLLTLVIGSFGFAQQQQPPQETGPFRQSDLVELIKLDPTIKLDIRYATKNNFLGKPVYKEARAFLQRPAAEALVRINQSLRKQGYGLIIHDGYRPWYVTRIFWDVTPEDKKIFVADPAKGSRHNRGCAVDLTLMDATGKEIDMGTPYDFLGKLAEPRHEETFLAEGKLTQVQLDNRHILRDAMVAGGFKTIPNEWWHFNYLTGEELHAAYKPLDVPFEQLSAH